MSERAPKLWSDFDGTAVQLKPKWDPRNWSKYPLPAVNNYSHFLSGVASQGVALAGVVSRRTTLPFLLRQTATERSIRKLGFGELFGESAEVALMGSEERKASFVADETLYDRVGMLDDKPHKFGVALLDALTELDKKTILTPIPVVIGAVMHRRTSEYMSRLAEEMEHRDGVELTASYGSLGEVMVIRSEGVAIDVVQVPYTYSAGREFGVILNSSIN